MNGNIELLNHIYQNSQMGTETITQLLDITEDAEFKSLLHEQYDDYNRIKDEAKSLLNQNGCDEKGLNAFKKMRTHLMIDMQTVMDNSPSHIAEMMIIGSNMGVINAIKSIKKHENVNPEILGLMEQLKAREENNISALKSFL